MALIRWTISDGHDRLTEGLDESRDAAMISADKALDAAVVGRAQEATILLRVFTDSPAARDSGVMHVRYPFSDSDGQRLWGLAGF